MSISVDDIRDELHHPLDQLVLVFVLLGPFRERYGHAFFSALYFGIRLGPWRVGHALAAGIVRVEERRS